MINSNSYRKKKYEDEKLNNLISEKLILDKFKEKSISESDEVSKFRKQKKISMIFLSLMCFLNLITLLLTILEDYFTGSVIYTVSLAFNCINLILFTIITKKSNLIKILENTYLFMNYFCLLCFITFISKGLGNIFLENYTKLNDLYFIIVDLSYILLNTSLYFFSGGKIKIMIANILQLSCILLYFKDFLNLKIIVMIFRIIVYSILFFYFQMIQKRMEYLEFKLIFIAKKFEENEESLFNTFKIKKVILMNKSIIFNSFKENNILKINDDEDKMNFENNKKLNDLTFKNKNESTIIKKSGIFENENLANMNINIDVMKNSRMDKINSYNNDLIKYSNNFNSKSSKLFSFHPINQESEKLVYKCSENLSKGQYLLNKIPGLIYNNSDKSFDFLKNFIDIKNLYSNSSSLIENIKNSNNINFDDSEKQILFNSEDIVFNRNNLKNKETNFNLDENKAVSNSEELKKSGISKKVCFDYPKKDFAENYNNVNCNGGINMKKEKAKSYKNISNFYYKYLSSGKNLDQFVKKIKTQSELKWDFNNVLAKKSTLKRKFFPFFKADTLNKTLFKKNSNQFSNNTITIDYCSDISEKPEKSHSKDTYDITKHILEVNSHKNFCNQSIYRLSLNNELNKSSQNIKSSKIKNLNSSLKNESFSNLINESMNEKNFKDTSIVFENNLIFSDMMKENDSTIQILKENNKSLKKNNSNKDTYIIEERKIIDSKNGKNLNRFDSQEITKNDKKEGSIIQRELNQNNNHVDNYPYTSKFSNENSNQNNLFYQDNSTRVYNIYNNFGRKSKNSNIKNNSQNFNSKKKSTNSHYRKTFSKTNFSSKRNFNAINETKISSNYKPRGENTIPCFIEKQNIISLGLFVNPYKIYQISKKDKIENFKETNNENHIYNSNLNLLEDNKINENENIIIENDSTFKQENEFIYYDTIYEVFLSQCKMSQDEIKTLYFKEINLELIRSFLILENKKTKKEEEKIQEQVLEQQQEQEQEHKLIAQEERFIEMQKLQNQQISKLIHELKTPLNSIIGLTVNIIQNYYTEDQLDNINLLGDLSKYATYLINDITQTLNKKLIETYKLNIVEINLRNILEFCFNILKALLRCYDDKTARIQPKFEFDENIENFKIFSDEVRLKQIILNFLSNSVKFTKKGFIKIEARVSSEIIDTIEIIIKDSGIGMEEKKVAAFNNYDETNSNLNNAYNSLYITNLQDIKSCKDSFSKSQLKNTNQNYDKLSKIAYNRDSNNLMSRKSSIIQCENSQKIKNYAGNNNEFGTGFGLTIAKRFGKRLGHKIELQSIYGESTFFTIRIFASERSQKFINERRDSTFSKKFDITKTYNEGKTEKEYKITLYRNLSDDDNLFNSKNDNNSINFGSYVKSEENIISPKSPYPYYQTNTIKIDSKEPMEFKYANFLKDNNNKTEESSFIESDLISKILNVRSLSKETVSYQHRKSIIQIAPTYSNNSLTRSVDNICISNNNCININNNNNFNINSKNTLVLNSNLNNSIISASRKSLNSILKFDKEFKYNSNNNHNCKILLIEDQKYIRKSIVNLLTIILKKKNLKWDILEGGDGLDLLNYIIEDNKYNNTVKLIITDENMEFINGTKAIELIRHLENENRILKNNKIIISTSAEQNDDLFNFYTMIGADHVLKKPCNEQSLFEILEKLNIFYKY